MTSPGDERAALEGGAEEFVERLAKAYAPEPMSAAERAGFDESLRARLGRRRRGPAWIPAVAAAAAALLVWVLVFEPTDPNRPPGRDEAGAMLAGAWEDELFLSSDLSASEGRAESEALPEDYVAIASAFLDG